MTSEVSAHPLINGNVKKISNIVPEENDTSSFEKSSYSFYSDCFSGTFHWTSIEIFGVLGEVTNGFTLHLDEHNHSSNSKIQNPT